MRDDTTEEVDVRTRNSPIGRWSPPSWVRVAGLAALLTAVLVMHGFGFGHAQHSHAMGTPPASASQQVAPDRSAPNSTAAHHQMMASGDHGTARNQDEPGHAVHFAQLCSAVLAILVLFTLSVLTGRALLSPWRMHRLRAGPVAEFATPVWLRPDIHVLCVMRT